MLPTDNTSFYKMVTLENGKKTLLQEGYTIYDKQVYLTSYLTHKFMDAEKYRSPYDQQMKKMYEN